MPTNQVLRRVSSCAQSTYRKLTEQQFIISFKQGHKQSSNIIAQEFGLIIFIYHGNLQDSSAEFTIRVTYLMILPQA